MNNVVAFPSRQRKPVEVSNELSPGLQELIYRFYEWAQDEGIDTDTVDFKYDAATVLAVGQSIIQRKK